MLPLTCVQELLKISNDALLESNKEGDYLADLLCDIHKLYYNFDFNITEDSKRDMANTMFLVRQVLDKKYPYKLK